MTLALPILVFGIIANILLGLFVFVRNRKSATNILFFLLTADISLWSVSNYFAITIQDPLTSLYWTRIVMALAVIQAVLFFLLIHTIPKDRIRLKARVMGVYMAAAAAAAGLSLSPYLFTSLIFVNGAPSPTPGPAMPVFVVVAVGSVFAGVLTVAQRMKKSSGAMKVQLQIVGSGIAAMFVLILLFNFVLVIVFTNSSFVSASPLYTLPFVVATAYAIIRHRFLDIRMVVARAVSYTVLMTLVAVVYALLFSLASTFFVTAYVDVRVVGISTVAAICMLLTFPVVKRMIEKATDAVLYKDKYNASLVMYHLAQIMARALRLEDLVHQLLSRLNYEMKIVHSCIVLVDRGKVFTVMTDGYQDPPEVPQYAASFLTAHGKTMMRDDAHPMQVQNFFDELDVSVILPLITGKGAIGLLCIGTKHSGEPYVPEDIETFEILAPEMAVAIENSLSYEEIRRFNVTLEEEVDHATAELKRVNKKLTELDKLKDEFVSLASHELRTPLTSIRSYLWMALYGKGGQMPEKQKYYLDRAFHAAERLIRLVNDMLNISRIESGRLGVQFVRTDVKNLLSEILPEIQPKMDEQGIRLHVTIPKDLPDIIADTDKIKEVFINLIGNAVKFTPTGGSITISADTVDSMVRVAISDTGAGFEPSAAEKLFSKFSTLHTQSSAHPNAFQSTGLGLYISKSIINMHGGMITACSGGLDKGAEFSFTLPQYSLSKRESLQSKYAQDGLGIIHGVVTSDTPS